MVALLVLVLAVGEVELGSQRRFEFWLVSVQPSEFAKLVLILALAAYVQRFGIRRARDVVATLALTAVPMALVLAQPNLSTAILLGAIWLGVALAAGLRAVHFSALALLVSPALLAVFRLGLLEGYQLDRIQAWLDPEFDPLDKGFQNIQTLIAVGNGGLTGTGYASGAQTQGGWLPLLYTDNIFALLAEELGFVGSGAVLLLLLFIVWRVLKAASGAQDQPGALIAVGVASYLLAQIFVNVGVVLQLLPVTGLSLPFISYGGSSLLTLMLAIGLVQGVLLRRKPLEFA
jgi:rod shape determining protein RodA